MKKIIFTLFVCTMLLGDATSNQVSAQCLATTMCPHLTTFSGNTRGYYFIAPVSFTICGLFVPTDASTDPQNIEVLQFHDSLPPTFPGFTNNFVSLYYTTNNAAASMIPVNIAVNAGDSIGVYGTRGTTNVNSYGMAQCITTILGNSVTLYRTGMQFSLNSQQMHDVWSENANQISRVIMYIDGGTSVPEVSMNHDMISIYPNPTNGVITVVNADKQNQLESIEIINVLGEKIYSASLKLQASKEIDLSGFPDGIYVIKIYSGESVHTEKIVKQ